MKISRRQFIKGAGAGVVGTVALSRFPWLVRDSSLARAAPEVDLNAYDQKEHQWVFICDNTACIGCGRCVIACKEENRVPRQPEYNRTWVERYVISEEGEAFVDSPKGGIEGFTAEQVNLKYSGLRIRKTFFVPKLCNQCDNPPCVRVCPVGATYMTKDGVVLVDQEACVGCGYCIQACPYGARYLIPEHALVTPTGQVGVADKCTWCYHRITKGLLPACVEACPVGARRFCDLRDQESPVMTMLREHRVGVLKPALGTKPKVFYIGLEGEVR